MFEFIANAIDQCTIFFAAIVAIIKTLPTSANCIRANNERGMMM
jgi:hypothetical protein